jgi:hypothetical protein
MGIQPITDRFCGEKGMIFFKKINGIVLLNYYIGKRSKPGLGFLEILFGKFNCKTFFEERTYSQNGITLKSASFNKNGKRELPLQQLNQLKIDRKMNGAHDGNQLLL